MLSLLTRYLSFGKARSATKAKPTRKMEDEDVKMVSIFNEEDIRQEFDVFGIQLQMDDQQLLDKRKASFSMQPP